MLPTRIHRHPSLVLALVVAASLTGCARPVPAPPPAVTDPAGTVVRDDLAGVLREAGVTGTFVLREGDGGPLTVVDRARAERRTPPESTFKLAHGLLALESGTVTDVDHQLLPYGGGRQPIAEWQQDMPMREAIRKSNAAIFVQLARRIGPEREQAWLDRLGYGNHTIGDRPDRFWLDGPLRISPVEQTAFVMALATRTLPVSRAAQDTMADIVRNPVTPNLYAKSGWGFEARPQTGWWVGWVERPGRPIASFALLIDMKDGQDAPKREQLARALLARLGVL